MGRASKTTRIAKILYQGVNMIKPLKNRVVAILEKPEPKTASGILLGEAKEKPAYAVVEAVGPEVKDLKKGDKILYKEYSATEIKIDTKTYLILEDKDILATL
jgi:chaperonin GroES